MTCSWAKITPVNVHSGSQNLTLCGGFLVRAARSKAFTADNRDVQVRPVVIEPPTRNCSRARPRRLFYEVPTIMEESLTAELLRNT